MNLIALTLTQDYYDHLDWVTGTVTGTDSGNYDIYFDGGFVATRYLQSGFDSFLLQDASLGNHTVRVEKDITNSISKSITIQPPLDEQPGCGEGLWYNRLPFFECADGYIHPDTGLMGSGVCYCQASDEAMQKYNQAQLDAADPLAPLLGDITGLKLPKELWLVIAAFAALVLIRR